MLFHAIASDVVLTKNNNFSNFKNQILERGVDHEVLTDVLVRQDMSPPSQSLSCFPFYKVTGYVTNSHWMGSHTNTRLPQQFIKLPWQSADTHIYSWVGGGNVEVKCIDQEHNSMTQPGLEPRPLNPDPSAPTIMSHHISHCSQGKNSTENDCCW